MEQPKKYEFSFDREIELVDLALSLSVTHLCRTTKQILSLDLDLNHVESYYIKTLLLLNMHLKEPFGIVPLGSRIDMHDNLTNIQGGLNDINKRFSGIIIEDVLEISFNSLYPIMMMNCTSEISDIRGINKLLKILYDHYKEDKKYNFLAKEYINQMFGMLMNTNIESYIRPNIDMGLIIRKSRHILSELQREFEGHYIYIDTDTIYFCRYKEIEERLDIHLNKYLNKKVPLVCNKNVYDSALFIRTKQHMLFKDGEKCYKGFKTLDNKYNKKAKGWY